MAGMCHVARQHATSKAASSSKLNSRGGHRFLDKVQLLYFTSLGCKRKWNKYLSSKICASFVLNCAALFSLVGWQAMSIQQRFMNIRESFVVEDLRQFCFELRRFIFSLVGWQAMSIQQRFMNIRESNWGLSKLKIIIKYHK